MTDRCAIRRSSSQYNRETILHENVGEILEDLKGQYHENEVNYRPRNCKGSEGLIYLSSSYIDDNPDFRYDIAQKSLPVRSYELMNQDRYIAEIQNGVHDGDMSMVNMFGVEDDVFRMLVMWISEEGFLHVHPIR